MCVTGQYSYLLTSQLDSQRIYWENKIVHLEKDTAEDVGESKSFSYLVYNLFMNIQIMR